MPSIHQRPDPDIARDAAVAIKDFLPTYHEQIKVVVKDGWITFEGEVEWQFQRQAPETAIRALQGIKGVTNLIKIKPRVTSEPPIHQFDALLGRLRLMSSWAAARLRSALVVLGIVLGLVPSPAPDRLRSAFLVLGIVLGLSGVWMVLPDLLSPKATGLPFDRNGAEAAAAHRTRAILAAEIGAIRGDLWANAAFTGARFMWTERLTSLDQTSSEAENLSVYGRFWESLAGFHRVESSNGI
jgi:hypothetical protein